MSSSATMTMESRPEPRASRKLLPDAVAGMLLFLFTETMLLAGMVSAHSIVKSGQAGEMWPPYGQPRLPVEETAFNTAALLLSGLVLVVSAFAYRKEPRRALAPMAIATFLGLFFVVFQGVEWAALIGEGLTLTSSAYGSFFYLIVGTHALHAIAAILCLAWAFFRLRRQKLTGAQMATVQIFWYWVVLAWPFLYVQVYL